MKFNIFTLHLGVLVIHVYGGTAMGFKSMFNDEGVSGEATNVGSCNDPATSEPVSPSLVAFC